MLFKKRIAAVMLAGMLAVSGAALSGCAQNGSGDGSQDGTSASASGADYYTNSEAIDINDMFTDRDLSASYDEEQVSRISLGKEDQVTITEDGTYIVSGTLKDGQIIVDAPDDAKVQIVLDGADITCGTSAAILVKSANKVFVTAAEGSENTLTVSGEYTGGAANEDAGKAADKAAEDSDTSAAEESTDSAAEDSAADDSDLSGVDAVIWSKCDLTINGAGSLTIKADYGHGIAAKDDLVLAGLDLTVKAEDKAINANDSVRVASGNYILKSGDDGIHAEDEDKGTGFVYIADGKIRIKSGDDGIHANTDLIVDGGTLNVKKCKEGLEGNTITINEGSVDVIASDDGINAAAGKKTSTDSGNEEAAADQSSDSAAAENAEKAAEETADKAASGFKDSIDYYDESCVIFINGGKVHVDADGDGIDSNGSITITGGATSVEGPENSGNGIMDVGGQGKATITGGTFFATGSAGMALQFSEESTQGCILTTVGAQAGTVTLTDADGNTIATQETDKQFACVQISSPDIKDGSTYTLNVGGNETEITMDGLLYGESNGMQGGMFGGGKHAPGAEGNPPDGTMGDGAMGDENLNGGNPNGGNAGNGEMKQRPDGERPQAPPNGEKPNGEKPSGHPDGKPSQKPGGSKTDDGSSGADTTTNDTEAQEL